jgi:uncharacterized Zn finger protein (UPF0148 family)
MLRSLNGSRESLPSSESSASLRSRIESGLSTPPTPSTPLPPEPAFPDIDPVAIQARRQQSDQASQEIGKLLLKGWMLLGDECPNANCHGIPLMKRPAPRPAPKDSNNTSGESRQPLPPRDPRKFCVICQQNFVGERELAEYNAATAESSMAQNPAVPSSDEPTVRSSSKRRYDDEAIQASHKSSVPSAKRKGTVPPPPIRTPRQVIHDFGYIYVADVWLILLCFIVSGCRHRTTCSWQGDSIIHPANYSSYEFRYRCSSRFARSRPCQAFCTPRLPHWLGATGRQRGRCNSRGNLESGTSSFPHARSVE